MTTDTVFAIFSCTKAITGVAVMQLVEEGVLGLGDPAKEYAPEIAEVQVLEGFDDAGEPRVRPPASDATVEQLMLHTAASATTSSTTTSSGTARGGTCPASSPPPRPR
jgi:methyl acetate hydrolase